MGKKREKRSLIIEWKSNSTVPIGDEQTINSPQRQHHLDCIMSFIMIVLMDPSYRDKPQVFVEGDSRVIDHTHMKAEVAHSHLFAETDHPLHQPSPDPSPSPSLVNGYAADVHPRAS